MLAQYVHTDPDGLPSFADKCSFRELVIRFIPLRECWPRVHARMQMSMTLHRLCIHSIHMHAL